MHAVAGCGLIGLDDPLARHWPEFAASGNADVLVRHLLAHKAGVLTYPRYWELIGRDADRLLDHEFICAELAAAAASWPAGSAFKRIWCCACRPGLPSDSRRVYRCLAIRRKETHGRCGHRRL